MKHTWNVTFLLLAFFFVAQVVGLFIVNAYIDHEQSAISGSIIEKPLPLMDRPEIDENLSWLPILSAIIFGTIIALVIIKLRLFLLWKFWFLLSVFFCLFIAFFAFFPLWLAFILALCLSLFKVFRPGLVIHNVSEIFLYGGLAAIFVFFMNLTSAFILLFFISLYDMFSVWQSKHMIKLAKFQTSQKLFAGVFIPYSVKGKTGKIVSSVKSTINKSVNNVKTKTVAVKSAILGGGDIGFPLIFTGVIFKNLVIIDGVFFAFLKCLIISVAALVALFWLFVKAENDKYYPAMPFISIGCVVGYLIILVINWL